MYRRGRGYLDTAVGMGCGYRTYKTKRIHQTKQTKRASVLSLISMLLSICTKGSLQLLDEEHHGGFGMKHGHAEPLEKIWFSSFGRWTSGLCGSLVG